MKSDKPNQAGPRRKAHKQVEEAQLRRTADAVGMSAPELHAFLTREPLPDAQGQEGLADWLETVLRNGPIGPGKR